MPVPLPCLLRGTQTRPLQALARHAHRPSFQDSADMAVAQVLTPREISSGAGARSHTTSRQNEGISSLSDFQDETPASKCVHWRSLGEGLDVVATAKALATTPF